jgi:hypothetical protein
VANVSTDHTFTVAVARIEVHSRLHLHEETEFEERTHKYARRANPHAEIVRRAGIGKMLGAPGAG